MTPVGQGIEPKVPVVKVLVYVQNMYVEILPRLCQKGSFKIDFLFH